MVRVRAWAWCAACCLALSAAASASPAHAREPAVRAASDAEVAELVERGIELRRLGQDAQALLLFEAALEKAPESARVRVHVATTHQALGQWLEADRYLRQLSLESGDPYVRKHQAALESARRFVERHVGSLEVTGDPAGAEIRLSGRRIGTLPLLEPVRLPVGSYVLEVHTPGHYSVVRPITLTGGGLLRESVSLAAREQLAPAPAPVAAGAAAAELARSPRWLTWTLAGAGAAAALSAGVAVLLRESHARRWNDPECLAPDMTRGQVCADELDAGRSAETLALASGVVSGVFFSAALASYLLEPPEPEARAEQSAARAAKAATLRCGVGWASAACAGTF